MLPDSNNKKSSFFIKGELVPQVSFIMDNAKIFAGVGVGFANGYGFKGLPNEIEKSLKDSTYLSPSDPEEHFGGYWIAEAGVEFLITPSYFLGVKYQYERTMTQVDTTVLTKKISAFVQQHNFMVTVGYKY